MEKICRISLCVEQVHKNTSLKSRNKLTKTAKHKEIGVPTLRQTKATDLTGWKDGLKLPWQTPSELSWREREHHRQWTIISASIDTELPDIQAAEYPGPRQVSRESWLFFLGGEMI